MPSEQRRINRIMADILERMICPGQVDWPPQTAREFLQLQFGSVDADRFHHLLFGQFCDTLSASEESELESYMFVNCFVEMLHEKARRSLAQGNPQSG